MSTVSSHSQPRVGVSFIDESTESTKRKKPQMMNQQSHRTAKRQKSTAVGERSKVPVTRSTMVTPITKSPMSALVVQSSPSPVAMPETSASPSNEETTHLASQDLGNYLPFAFKSKSNCKLQFIFKSSSVQV